MSLSDVRRFKLAQAGVLDEFDRRTPTRLTNWIKRREFPRLLGTHTTDLSASATSHNVNIGSPAAGEMVIVCIRSATACNFTTPGGWTAIWHETATDTVAVYYKRADGTEGATVTITSSVNTRAAAVALRYGGAGTPFGPWLIRRTNTTTVSHDPIHAGWGARENCYLIFDTWETNATVSSIPSGYGDNGSIVNTGSSGAGLARVAWCMKFARSSRDAPGNTVKSAVAEWLSIGILVPPG